MYYVCNAQAQFVDIPDTEFLKYLLFYYDENKNGFIEVSEVENITRFSVSEGPISAKIKNLQGIETFKKLEYRSLFQ